ncbi:MAG: thiamine phosphate synthase [Acidobacteriota bacterium]|nr:thiamine phosphate synthase [Acidobacteriota bacterium]
MMLCLVTDRRRLAAALGIEAGAWDEALRTQVRAAAEAGVDLVQVREPDLDTAALVALVKAIVSDLRGTASRVLVNDRLDVAWAAGAAGVHLKERSFPVGAVRRVTAPGFWVGRSVHSEAAAVSAGDADYLIAGTVRPTVSKPSARCLGWEGLAAVVDASAGRPVLAIGGIDLPSIPLVAVSGAAGVAAIGAFIPLGGESLSEFVQKRVIDMRLGFDSGHAVS